MRSIKGAVVYSDWVEAMARAIHADCELEWQAIAVVDPQRQFTLHLPDAHYGQAHLLVRRLDKEFDLGLDTGG